MRLRACVRACVRACCCAGERVRDFLAHTVATTTTTTTKGATTATKRGSDMLASPTDYAIRLRAADLVGALKPGDAVTSWTSMAATGNATFSVPATSAAPTFELDANQRPSVVFTNETKPTSLVASSLSVPADSTLVAVMRDDGSTHAYVHAMTGKHSTSSSTSCCCSSWSVLLLVTAIRIYRERTESIK